MHHKLKTSTAKLKSKEEKGQPCLSPLHIFTSLVGNPLTSIEIEAVVCRKIRFVGDLLGIFEDFAFSVFD